MYRTLYAFCFAGIEIETKTSTLARGEMEPPENYMANQCFFFPLIFNQKDFGTKG